mmetsp:Transcript_11793/g.33989  ORF Transcript_11793/g.33989 Transcript_11793/m.33989 type:complete len:214 (-) Transcript_11793:858-1499(-)
MTSVGLTLMTNKDPTMLLTTSRTSITPMAQERSSSKTVTRSTTSTELCSRKRMNRPRWRRRSIGASSTRAWSRLRLHVMASKSRKRYRSVRPSKAVRTSRTYAWCCCSLRWRGRMPAATSKDNKMMRANQQRTSSHKLKWLTQYGNCCGRSGSRRIKTKQVRLRLQSPTSIHMLSRSATTVTTTTIMKMLAVLSTVTATRAPTAATATTRLAK